MVACLAPNTHWDPFQYGQVWLGKDFRSTRAKPFQAVVEIFCELTETATFVASIPTVVSSIPRASFRHPLQRDRPLCEEVERSRNAKIVPAARDVSSADSPSSAEYEERWPILAAVRLHNPSDRNSTSLGALCWNCFLRGDTVIDIMSEVINYSTRSTYLVSRHLSSFQTAHRDWFAGGRTRSAFAFSQHSSLPNSNNYPEFD